MGRRLRNFLRKRGVLKKPVYPKATAPSTLEAYRRANERADRWQERCYKAREGLLDAQKALIDAHEEIEALKAKVVL